MSRPCRGVEQRDHPRTSSARRRLAGVLVVVLASAAGAGCSVKKTVTVPVKAKVLSARSATLDELLALLGRYVEKVEGLSSTTLRVTFTSGKIESGKLQEYRSAPGYVLLKRPDSLRLNIQNPLTKTSIVELATRGDDFWIWYPRDNKFFVGRNSIRELEVDGTHEGGPAFTARPVHIFDAIALRGVTERPGIRVALEEEQDLEAKYYVVTVFTEAGRTRLHPQRRVWFERSEMAVTRQKTYGPDGSLQSIIHYSDFTPVEGVPLPRAIRIERPADSYSLDIAVRSWRLNPEIPATAFALTAPATARTIQLREKGAK